ncbi:MAG: hypothetical protein ACRBBT_07505 [Paracoccaceae bacterium]
MSFVVKLLGAVMFRILTRLMMMLVLLGALSFAVRYVPGMQGRMPDFGALLANYRTVLTEPEALNFGQDPAMQASDAMASAQQLLLGAGDAPSSALPPQATSAMVGREVPSGGAMAGIMQMVLKMGAAGGSLSGASSGTMPDYGAALAAATAGSQQMKTAPAQSKPLSELQKLRQRNYPRNGLSNTVSSTTMKRVRAVPSGH